MLCFLVFCVTQRNYCIIESAQPLTHPLWSRDENVTEWRHLAISGRAIIHLVIKFDCRLYISLRCHVEWSAHKTVAADDLVV